MMTVTGTPRIQAMMGMCLSLLNQNFMLIDPSRPDCRKLPRKTVGLDLQPQT